MQQQEAVQTFIGFCFILIFMSVCVLQAKKKGYSVLRACLFGFIGGLLSMIVYLCLPKTQKVKDEETLAQIVKYKDMGQF